VADYTYGQLETLWTNAGGSKALAPLMAAIALAESGGNPNAENTTDNNGTQTSWGLWQISNGTHGQPVAGILTPSVNAQQAVAKYKDQGLGAWGTYTSGAYQQYYQGSTPATALPQGGGGSSSGSTTSTAQQAELDSFSPGDATWLEGPQGIIQGIASMLAGGVTGAASDAQSAEGVWKSLSILATEGEAVLKDVEWLFVPSHWVRIIAFGNGMVLGAIGLHYLGRTGQGDLSLAVGILLIVLAGIAFFVAFHNLPDDVTSFAGLLQWISDGLRKNAPQPVTA
jgi:hypothetical protein